MKEKIVLFGTGDIAQLANYYFENDSNYEVAAFTVDDDYVTSDEFEGKPVIPYSKLQKEYPSKDYKCFVALSYAKMNTVRMDKYFELKKNGYELVSYVSSRCSFLTQYAIGDNCFILEDNTIQPFVKIGSNVTIWSGNHLGHHSTIGDHNFISSHVVISGHCTIKNNCFLGVNATIGHQTTIEEYALIGAGSVITKSIAKKSVYVPPKSTLFPKSSDQIQL